MYVYDVAVVGAGPAGSMVAKHTAKLGLSTILLEEHKAIGIINGIDNKDKYFLKNTI